MPDPMRPGNPCAKRISRAVSAVARSNATAALPNGFAGVPPALITELMDKNLAVNYGPVLVPVLAR